MSIPFAKRFASFSLVLALGLVAGRSATIPTDPNAYPFPAEETLPLGTGGVVVRGTSPTRTTPVIGLATGASLALSSLTAGRVAFAGVSGLLDDDSRLQWDDTNKYLGVMSVSPARYPSTCTRPTRQLL